MLKTVQEYTQTGGGQARHAQMAAWCFKGVGDENMYVMEINPATGQIPVTFAGLLNDFGDTTLAPRFATMIGSWDVLPVPGAGAKGFTGTPFAKAVANDARSLDTLTRFSYNGSFKYPTFDNGTPANNIATPVVLVQGQGEAPINVSTAGNVITELYAGLLPERWNGLTVAYPVATRETYAFYSDVGKTTLICTVTVDYVDATKEQLSSVTRV